MSSKTAPASPPVQSLPGVYSSPSSVTPSLKTVANGTSRLSYQLKDGRGAAAASVVLVSRQAARRARVSLFIPAPPIRDDHSHQQRQEGEQATAARGADELEHAGVDVGQAHAPLPPLARSYNQRRPTSAASTSVA